MGQVLPESRFDGSVEPYYAVRTPVFGPTGTDTKISDSMAENRGILWFELFLNSVRQIVVLAHRQLGYKLRRWRGIKVTCERFDLLQPAFGSEN